MDTIYQHFRPDEKEFIDQVLSWKQFVEDTYAPKLTDFLDPRMQQIVETIIGTNSDIRLASFGGYLDAERKRMLLYPDYFQPNDDDFHLTLFEIQYPSKFVTIAHNHVLGSLMSLGVKREKYGDILIHDERIQFFITNEMSEYVKLEFKQIGKTTIQLIEKDMNDVISTREEWKEAITTVSSMRLDAILSAIYLISRQKTQMLINRGYVKVNWKVIEDPSFQCQEGDYFSVRGYGRSKLMSLEGKTKKEKWRITTGILK